MENEVGEKGGNHVENGFCRILGYKGLGPRSYTTKH